MGLIESAWKFQNIVAVNVQTFGFRILKLRSSASDH